MHCVIAQRRQQYTRLAFAKPAMLHLLKLLSGEDGMSTVSLSVFCFSFTLLTFIIQPVDSGVRERVLEKRDRFSAKKRLRIVLRWASTDVKRYPFFAVARFQCLFLQIVSYSSSNASRTTCSTCVGVINSGLPCQFHGRFSASLLDLHNCVTSISTRSIFGLIKGS